MKRVFLVMIRLFIGLLAPTFALALTMPTAPLLQNLIQVNPVNLLVMGKSHNLFTAAYNDYTDLTGDGVPDIGYTPKSIDYYGYFDSYKCYKYSSSMFKPNSTTANKKCDGASWSGDFLNYVTMSRIDVLRKSLYGGKRTSGTTGVLVRSQIPLDSHVWGKSFTSSVIGGDSLSSYVDTTFSVSDYGSTSATRTIASALSSGRAIVMANMDDSFPGTPLLRVVSMNPSTNTMNDWLSTDGNANLSTQYTWMAVKIQVCVAGMLESNCTQYGSNYLPTGLLHKYGVNGNMEFGLITGSYDFPQLGGVLRDSIRKFSAEVNSDGSFISGGIVDTLDRLRINKPNSSYDPSTSGSGNWGNPISTMYYEALRYLAGKSGPTFITGSTGIDTSTFGLPKVTSWTNPYASRPWCSKPFITVISEAISSYDSQVPGSPWGFSYSKDISSNLNVSTLGKTLWGYEGYGSQNVLIGEVSGGTADGLPTSKSASNFDIRGLSPDEPARQGSYYSAMEAYFARTTPIISPAAVPTGATLAPIRTYAIGLSSPLPKVSIPLTGGTITVAPYGRVVYAIPGFSLTTLTISNFYLLSAASDGSYYKFQVNYDDSEFGNDYDLDAIAVYEVTKINNTQVQVKVTSTYAASGNSNHMGFIISGAKSLPGASSANQAGAYLVVRENESASQSECVGTTVGSTRYSPLNYGLINNGYCSNVLPLNFTGTFTVDTSQGTTTTLQSPLWYMAKYGGFADNKTTPSTPNTFDPTQTWQWDADGNGLPDAYSLVSNPAQLNSQLDKAFQNISNQNGSATGGTGSQSSISSTSNTYYYEAGLNTSDWSGSLIQRLISVSGSSVSLGTAQWNAQTKLTSDSGRQIITSSDGIGMGAAFLWSGLTGTQQSALKSSSGESTATTQLKLSYLRGNAGNEGTGSSQFRPRTTTKLGDIVNSSPQYVGAPSTASSNINYQESSYKTFATNYASRTPIVYVGANDGMLHAFDATNSGGTEKLAFLPNAAISNLNQLPSNAYAHAFYVDAPPVIADVKNSSGSWMTLLAGGMGAGGQALYALDVTNPANFLESQASNLVKWEFSSAADSDLGYTFGQPAIAKLNDGNWYVVANNGYNSSNGDAVLFIIPVTPAKLTTTTTGWVLGSNYYKINTSSGTTASINGLSAVTPVDLDGDGKVDVIYAGDLKGNVWKFDMSGTTPATWKVALGGKALFTAKSSSGNLQPVVLPPAVGAFPAAAGVASVSKTNLMVYVGTGKYIESCDKSSSCTPESNNHTVYGIWDWGVPVCARSLMLPQTLDSIDLNASGAIVAAGSGGSKTYRTVSKNAITWKDASLATSANADCTVNGTTTKQEQNISSQPGYLGWYEDLNLSGERAVGAIRFQSKTVEYQTYIPATSTSDVCTPTDQSFVIRVSADNGGAFSVPKLSDSAAQALVNGQYRNIVGVSVGGSLGSTDYSYNGKVITVTSGTSGVNSMLTWNLSRTWQRLTWRELINN